MDDKKLPVIGYAEPAFGDGLTVDSMPGQARVVVPRPGFGTIFLQWETWSFVAAGFPIWFAMEEGYSVRRWVAVLVIAAIWRLVTVWRKRVFYVDAIEVSTGYEFGKFVYWIRWWPRSDVGEIKFNKINGKLLIRITGKDIVEFYVSPDRRVTELVADVLQKALRGEVGDSGGVSDKS